MEIHEPFLSRESRVPELTNIDKIKKYGPIFLTIGLLITNFIILSVVIPHVNTKLSSLESNADQIREQMLELIKQLPDIFKAKSVVDDLLSKKDEIDQGMANLNSISSTSGINLGRFNQLINSNLINDQLNMILNITSNYYENLNLINFNTTRNLNTSYVWFMWHSSFATYFGSNCTISNKGDLIGCYNRIQTVSGFYETIGTNKCLYVFKNGASSIKYNITAIQIFQASHKNACFRHTYSGEDTYMFVSMTYETVVTTSCLDLSQFSMPF